MSPTRVAIGVCTARRPDLLKCCLAALADQVIPEGVDVTIIVADNEPEPNNQPLMAEFAATCPFAVEYVHEPTRGISRARNALLSACEGRFDWIAMTDDDCKPTPTWLADMLAAAHRHGADVVRGRHIWTPPETGAYWYMPHPSPRYAEGQRIEHAGGGNVIFVGWIARMRFDESLAHGEDTDFFYRAAKRGARIVYSAEPLIYEAVPPHRATLQYQTLRSFYFAASRSHFHRRYRGFDTAAVKVLARLVWQVPINVVRLVTAPLLWPFSERRFKAHVVKGLRRLAAAAGAVVGLAGFSGNPYG
jgi:succinoglycan biosynthesis protein ExoM